MHRDYVTKVLLSEKLCLSLRYKEYVLFHECLKVNLYLNVVSLHVKRQAAIEDACVDYMSSLYTLNGCFIFPWNLIPLANKAVTSVVCFFLLATFYTVLGGIFSGRTDKFSSLKEKEKPLYSGYCHLLRICPPLVCLKNMFYSCSVNNFLDPPHLYIYCVRIQSEQKDVRIRKDV